MILAIDFDGTIADSAYPECGTIKPHAREVINELYDAGHEIIIWTCRWEEPQQMAVDFLATHGIKYHQINEHMPHTIEKYGNDTRKIYADLYIDDKQLGGLPECWLDIRKLLKDKHGI